LTIGFAINFKEEEVIKVTITISWKLNTF
jgi:hypothetical protein